MQPTAIRHLANQVGIRQTWVWSASIAESGRGTLPETNSSYLPAGKPSHKGNNRLPTIHCSADFRVMVSGRGFSWFSRSECEFSGLCTSCVKPGKYFWGKTVFWIRIFFEHQVFAWFFGSKLKKYLWNYPKINSSPFSMFFLPFFHISSFRNTGKPFPSCGKDTSFPSTRSRAAKEPRNVCAGNVIPPGKLRVMFRVYWGL